MIELSRHHNAQALKVGRSLVVVNDMPLRDEQQVARLYSLLVGVDAVLHPTLDAESHDDEVDATGAFRQEVVEHTMAQHQAVAHCFDILALAHHGQRDVCDDSIFLCLTHQCWRRWRSSR